jgi:hypothetical protein
VHCLLVGNDFLAKATSRGCVLLIIILCACVLNVHVCDTVCDVHPVHDSTL